MGGQFTRQSCGQKLQRVRSNNLGVATISFSTCVAELYTIRFNKYMQHMEEQNIVNGWEKLHESFYLLSPTRHKFMKIKLDSFLQTIYSG